MPKTNDVMEFIFLLVDMTTRMLLLRGESTTFYYEMNKGSIKMNYPGGDLSLS